jgi:hypothetical protein
MFLARLPDGATEPFVYQVPNKVLVLEGEVQSILDIGRPKYRMSIPRAWRYDSKKLKPHAALHSSGVAAIDRTEDGARMKLKVFLTRERFGPVSA